MNEDIRVSLTGTLEGDSAGYRLVAPDGQSITVKGIKSHGRALQRLGSTLTLKGRLVFNADNVPVLVI